MAPNRPLRIVRLATTASGTPWMIALLRGTEGIAPLAPPRDGMRLSWFVDPVRLEPSMDRDEIADRLAEHGIATRPYFWPIHLQPFYQKRFGFRPGDFPHSEAAGLSHLALPFHGGLTESDIAYVCETLVREVRTARARHRQNPVPLGTTSVA